MRPPAKMVLCNTAHILHTLLTGKNRDDLHLSIGSFSVCDDPCLNRNALVARISRCRTQSHHQCDFAGDVCEKTGGYRKFIEAPCLALESLDFWMA